MHDYLAYSLPSETDILTTETSTHFSRKRIALSQYIFITYHSYSYIHSSGKNWHDWSQTKMKVK